MVGTPRPRISLRILRLCNTGVQSLYPVPRAPLPSPDLMRAQWMLGSAGADSEPPSCHPGVHLYSQLVPDRMGGFPRSTLRPPLGFQWTWGGHAAVGADPLIEPLIANSLHQTEALTAISRAALSLLSA